MAIMAYSCCRRRFRRAKQKQSTTRPDMRSKETPPVANIAIAGVDSMIQNELKRDTLK